MTTSERTDSSDQTLYALKQGILDYQVDRKIAVEFEKKHKKFTSLSGPAGVGKTTIGDKVIALEPSIQLGDTTTNRPRKATDPPGFRTGSEGVTLTALIDDIKQHKVLNYSVIPETSTVYAFYPEGLRGEHTIGPLTADNVNTFFNLGLAEYEPVYIISPVEVWSQFIRKSLGERPDQISHRMGEAIESLEFARNNLGVFRFVENTDENDGIIHAAEAVIAITMHRSYPIVTQEKAAEALDEMIAYAKHLAVQ